MTLAQNLKIGPKFVPCQDQMIHEQSFYCTNLSLRESHQRSLTLCEEPSAFEEAQKSKVYDVDDPSTWKVSDLTQYLKDFKVSSSGFKKTRIQRVIDRKAGLLRTRVVGEKRSREESGGVIEDGDVGAGSSVYQGRGRRKVTPLLVVEVM